MENNLKVSVVVATFRRDQKLKRALESLVNQSYKNIEVIIVDDNANEVWNKTVMEIIDQVFKATSVSYMHIINSINSGSAQSRNIGIKASNGQYITFLDDDDTYLSEKIQNQLSNMIEFHSDYSLTDLWLYDDNDVLVEKRKRDYLLICKKEELFTNHMKYHMTGTDVMMFKKSYIEKIGLFPPIDVGDEFYLMLRAIQGNGVFSYTPNCYVKAYVHTSSTGLSSGESKLNGEKKLFKFKKKYFNMLKNKDKRYIIMRHYAVLAYAEYRRKKYLRTLLYIFFSFIYSPINLLNMFFQRK